MKVIKRDGKTIDYDMSKIRIAVGKANEATKEMSEDDLSRITDIINNKIIKMKDPVDVEVIQDVVEDSLMKNHFYKTAKSYILYRDERDRVRRGNSKILRKIAKKINAVDVANQNANVDELSFGGRKGEADRVLMKDFALNYCMSKKSRENHLNNEIYIHDLDSYALGEHNCFDRETTIVTYDGVKKFKELTPGQEVTIIDKDGVWRPATVKTYGKQKMYELTFSAGLTEKTITCTRDHRWLLLDGSITNHIEVGDRLALTQALRNDYVLNESLWCFGFVLGDGWDRILYSKDRSHVTNGTMQVRLCGSKTKYIDIFKRCDWSIRQTFSNGDCLLSSAAIGAFKQIFLDYKIWKLMSHDELCNIFNGYFAADGHADNLTIATSDERLVEFMEYASAPAGYYMISKHKTINDTNFKAARVLYNIKFSIKQSNNRPWRLKTIKVKRVCDQVAWCLEEPVTHTFTLANGMITGNCLSIPFDQLLANGFNTRQTDVRPANSVNTAFQLLAVIFQLQSLQQFGGVSATHLDWTMAPYVRKSFKKHFLEGLHYLENTDDWDIDWDVSIEDDRYKEHGKAYKYAMDMTEKELQQAVEGMYHNLNTLQSRSGNQLPFTSINYGTCVSTEGRMVIKALLEGSIKGVGKLHKTPIFPCGIFQYMEGVNDKPGTPNYDMFRLALKSTSKRIYPNYCRVNWSNNAGYDVNDPKTYFSTMGCRTANGADINAEPGVNPQTKDGRGNLAPVTIILPTLAMEAREQEGDTVENFMKILDKKIHEAKDMLIERYEYMCAQSPDSAKFMYENNTMLGYHPEEGIRSALKHGTLVIGQLGLAETLQALIGKNQCTEEGMVLAKRIEQLYKDRCAEFKNQYRLNFGVYFSPAENLAYTAMNNFKKKYGEIPGVSDKEYFTNSMHVPVWEDVNAFEKIDIESQLTGYSNAGCITYVELPNSVGGNIDALESIVDYAMSKDIPYLGINIPLDECLDCGQAGEFNGVCPACGSHHIRQLRRVTGYLTGDYKTAFNYGKQCEVRDRVKHMR